jgi:Pentapeptide repeats (8 copies)
MRRIVELPLARHQGLRKLSPDLISKARDETATQVTRVGLTFLGTTVFCLLSLLSPDTALLGGSEKLNVPFAGPVSFLGFMLLGPAILIVLRVYLQIYVEHSARLDRLARSVSAVRPPTLIPLKNSLIRLFSGLIFYTLLPVAMMLFAWKAAVFPAWGLALFSVAAAVIAGHVMLSSSTVSWRSKGLWSVSVAMIAGAAMIAFGPPRRPFELYLANLSGQWLWSEDLRNANLNSANLSRASLPGSNLSGANLSSSDLRGTLLLFANLHGANLSAARLGGADLSGADLIFADLSDAHLNANLRDAQLGGADLGGADLSGAQNLTQTQLDGACSDPKTKLPEGLTPTLCPKGP